VDEDGFTSWFHRTTHTPASQRKAWEEASLKWRRSYWLEIDRGRVEELAQRAAADARPVFLCGTTSNDNDIWDLFDRVIQLSVGDDVLQDRLAARTNNDYGKHPDDLGDILGWNGTIDGRHRASGAVVIDADRPVDDVVDDIVAQMTG